MLATSDEKPEKDFMNIGKIKLCLLLLFPAIGVYGQTDEPIPFVSFTEITINMTFPQYRPLSNDGGFVEIDGGVRGIIVYRVDATTFIAFERNCSYQAGSACAQVDVDISRLFLIDRCCGSNFSLSDGYPTKGPASRALRRYRIEIAGSTLTVTDEVLN